ARARRPDAVDPSAARRRPAADARGGPDVRDAVPVADAATRLRRPRLRRHGRRRRGGGAVAADAGGRHRRRRFPGRARARRRRHGAARDAALAVRFHDEHGNRPPM
ncbi:MAG: hypothetical protein AVDCRST_MAG04-1826, partial [uncultured Acetobacteraceae bacterium]